MHLAVFLQARGPFLRLLQIYLISCTVPLGLGAYLLIAPRRAGNFLNDAFAVFPHVEPEDRWKKLLYRGLGGCLVLVSTFYIRQIYVNSALPMAHFIRSRYS